MMLFLLLPLYLLQSKLLLFLLSLKSTVFLHIILKVDDNLLRNLLMLWRMGRTSMRSRGSIVSLITPPLMCKIGSFYTKSIVVYWRRRSEEHTSELQSQ